MIIRLMWDDRMDEYYQNLIERAEALTRNPPVRDPELNIIEGLPPLVDVRARVLILGSMPSETSRRFGQYYAFPRNQFWLILGEVFHTSVPDDYADRRAFLARNRLGVWDVVGRCRRMGSRDDTIRDPKVNDLEGFMRDYPNIRRVYCNGRKSYDLFRLHFGALIRPVYLPSSSPLHTIPLRDKVQAWSRIRDAG